MTRFTPVRLQAVHSNLLHQHKQEETETVDQYAQELRKLFYRAYPKASQATGEAEGFGRSVLAYQFVAGLKRNLQSKVPGVEGDFEQLLLRACFEEAKIRDLSSQSDRRPGSGNSSHSSARRSTPAGQKESLRQEVGPIQGKELIIALHVMEWDIMQRTVHIREEVLQLKQ